MSYLRLQALKHEDYGRNRRLLEYGAAAAGVVVAAYYFAIVESTLLRAGLAALTAGALYWLVQWRRSRLTWSAASRAEAEDALTFYSGELTRLRDAHRELRKTHLVAAVPGALLICAWRVLETPLQEGWWHAALSVLAVAAWIGSMIWHETEKAREYQRELEALRQHGD